jgi:hypothetical protein
LDSQAIWRKKIAGIGRENLTVKFLIAQRQLFDYQSLGDR